jgi:hypothetical protein
VVSMGRCNIMSREAWRVAIDAQDTPVQVEYS